LVSRLSKWLPETARGAEIVFLSFAGHGAVQRVGRREEGFLLPYDADPEDLVTRGVAMSDLSRWIEGIEAEAVVVCLDCCHAARVITRRGIRPALFQGLSGKGRHLFASCDEGQVSVEVEPLGHGLFTYHLLRGLRGEADRDGNGRVGVSELFEFVAEEVERDAKQLGYVQKPWKNSTGPGGSTYPGGSSGADKRTCSRRWDALGGMRRSPTRSRKPGSPGRERQRPGQRGHRLVPADEASRGRPVRLQDARPRVGGRARSGEAGRAGNRLEGVGGPD
jgi:hypothetical protein